MMKRALLSIVTLGLPLASSSAFADGGQLTPGGLTKVTHGSEMTGNGTTTSSLVFTPCGSAGQAWVWNGSAYACATVGGGLSGLTTGDLIVATSATTGGNFAGSDPGACTAGQADTHPALSAAGVLSKSCSVFVNAAGTGLSLSGSTLSLPNVGPGASSYTYSSITLDAQGRITAASSGATPALAATTITAGTMLSGGGDLSANRTISLADIATSTVIGRVAAGTGAPSALTTTQLTTLINPFTSTLSGAVPASGGGTTTYLRADGSFATPPGTGVTSVATGTGLTGGTITSTGTLSLSINGGATQTATAGQAWTSMTAAGILSSSVFVNAAGTGLVLTGSSLSVGLNGNASQACSAGNAVTGLSATGIETCNTLATLGAAAGTGTANKVTKWNNTSGALVDSSITDNGTTVSTIENGQFGGSSAATLSVINVAGSGVSALSGTLNVVAPSSNNGLVVSRAAVDTTGAQFNLFKTRNADASVKTAVATSDVLGVINFQGASDSATITKAASIEGSVTGTVATGVLPSQIAFKTMTTGGTLTTALTLGNDQSATFAASGTFATTLGVTGLSTLTGGFTAGAASGVNGTLFSNALTIKSGNSLILNNAGNTGNIQMFYDGSEIAINGQVDLGSHKLTSLTNGSASSDAAAFGQLATAVNAAVSGTSGRVAVFNGTNSVTGYAGFTSDTSGNITAGLVTAFSAGSTNGFFSNGAQSTAYGLRMESTSSPASNGFQLRIRDLVEGDFEIFDETTNGKPIYIDAGDGTTLQRALTAGFSDASGYYGVNIIDTTSAAQNDGGAIVLSGAYTGTTTTPAVLFKALKENGTTGDYSYGLAIGARLNGNADISKGIYLASTGTTTMLGQGLGVGGLYQGQAQDVGDVLQSGLIAKNFIRYSDQLGNASDASQAQTTTGNDAGWGFNNATSTIAYTDLGVVNAPWYPSAITPAAGGVGKITCTNGAGNCTTAATSDWRSIDTSTTTGIADLRSTTSTFSVWLQMVSGTNAGAVISIARYNDNEKTAATCPTVTATGWVRCSVTKAWSSTSYADNSQIRVYIEPRSTTAMYIAGAQLEQNSVPTMYQPNDGTGIGVYNTLPPGGPGGLVTTPLVKSDYGAWVREFGVGGLAANSPKTTISPWGVITTQYLSAGGGQFNGDVSFLAQSYFAHAAAISYTSLTNTGVLNYDTTGHTLTLAAQYTSGTSEIDLATSSTANAATQVAITNALVTITPATTHSNNVTINGASSGIPLNVSDATQATERIRFSGQEYLASAHTDTNGPALLLMVNRSSDRRIALVDSANEALNNSAPQLQFGIDGSAAYIDSGSTDATTAKTLNINTRITSPLVLGGTVTANSTLTTKGTLQVNNASTAKWSVDTNGHEHGTGVSPSLTSCGTSPAVVGGDLAFRVTTGSSGTTCTITFANAFATNAPICSVWAEGTTTMPTCTITTSAITCTVTVASTKYDWNCIAPN